MSEQLKYCMGCMRSIPDDTVICPHCCYSEEETQIAPYLEKGSIIADKYLVGRVLGTSPDSITYIGADINTGETLAIHEFYPEKMVERLHGESEIAIKYGYDELFASCIQSFLTLWREIDTFKDAHCLPYVLDITDFNGTVYAVCHYKDCITLREYFENSDSPLSWDRAFSAFKPIMYALKKLNSRGIVHGMLSPESIHVGADGKLHLTGFSISKCFEGLDEFVLTPKPGFTAVEIYNNKGVSAATDVYSVTALLYYSITKLTPPEATERAINDTTTLPAAIADTLTSDVISALISGLSIYPESRFSNFDALIAALSHQNPRTIPQTQHSPAKPSQERKPATQKEEVDMELEKEQAEKARSKAEKQSARSAFSLGLKAFGAGFVLCAVIFCALYGTVLYKSYPIDFLDKALSYISFLPMNNPQETTESTTTTAAPTEPRYISVADFVNNHTYESVKASTYFNENYTLIYDFQPSSTYPKNSIISQSIEPDTSVVAGTQITLVISTGKKRVTMPDVIGMNYVKAQSTLEALELTVKIQVFQNGGSHAVGEVYSTDKAVGDEMEIGTVVTINVWGRVTAVVTTTKPTTTKPSASTSAAAGSAAITKPATTTKPTTTLPEPSTETTTRPTTTRPTTTAPGSTLDVNSQIDADTAF